MQKRPLATPTVAPAIIFCPAPPAAVTEPGLRHDAKADWLAINIDDSRPREPASPF
jgi:hypothetical protein